MRVSIPEVSDNERSQQFYTVCRPLRDDVQARPDAEDAVWEGGVTTCIVAISIDHKFVSASDMRLSFGGMCAADGVVKQEPFHGEWLALIGGDDISQAVGVIERATKILRGKGNDFLAVMAGFKQAYRAVYEETLEDELLAPEKMTLREFQRNGKKLLNAEVHADISFKKRSFNLGCAFLVYGYDQHKRPHIFEVRNPGKVTIHDKPGFWAIGSGARVALTMLSLLDQAREETWLQKTIYNVLAAKYASETASDVGPETFFSIVEYGSVAFSTQGARLEPEMRAIWEAEGKPRMPLNVMRVMEQAQLRFWPKRKPRKGAKALTLSVSQKSEQVP